MKSFLSFVNSKLPYDSVAIGKFDGMHNAHINLLDLVGENGCALSIASVVAPFISPPGERTRYSRVPFYRLRFDSIKEWDSIQFLKLILHILPSLKRIIVGYDFCFGKDRMSSATDLHILLQKLQRDNIEIVILESQKCNGTPIHTSIIKELIKYGDMQSANAMLCRFYSVKGLIISGQGLGKKELYPTINIRNTLYLVPKYGVYATFTLYEGKVYKSVSFLGNRLSTDSNFCIETHIFDHDIQVQKYEELRIFFIEHIRNNKKFDDLGSLKEQIAKDIQNAKAILQAIPQSLMLQGLKTYI